MHNFGNSGVKVQTQGTWFQPWGQRYERHYQAGGGKCGYLRLVQGVKMDG